MCDDVDRSREFVEQCPHRFGVGCLDRVDASGAGVLARPQTTDRFGERVVEHLGSPQESVGAGVDHERNFGGVRGRAKCPDVVGVLGGRSQPLLAVDGVFDVDADGAGVEDPFDQFGRGGVVAGLHVGTHRYIDCGGDATDPVEGVIERHCLVVALPARLCEGMAADRQRVKSGGDDRVGRPCVPHRREHQRGVLVMEIE
jgi:hypothetical protein